MAELLLDPQIRWWVFLPIVVITFLVGIVRHYVSLLIVTQKKSELTQVQDNQVLIRARMLRENGKYISKQGFYIRKHYFNHEETGYFKSQKRTSQPQNPMTDPTLMTEMLKGNITNVLPMIVIGGWINWMFSGFVTTKVPFPLTLRFKPMLQRGIELLSLDASWVSSASWYFLNVFGLRNVYSLVLGENNAAAEQDFAPGMMQIGGMGPTPPIDPKMAFKAEWEALEICHHDWALANVECDILGNQVVESSIQNWSVEILKFPYWITRLQRILHS